jgi:hypothetical protein
MPFFWLFFKHDESVEMAMSAQTHPKIEKLLSGLPF